jgi:hypothetical protein|tara:strand:+ start:915 stop:1163 length:249 start_codon:yes stop_codon:yes gene_type:complete
MSIPKTGTAVFGTEEQMDDFLTGMNPGSTVMIKETDTGTVLHHQCRWCPGTNIAKYFSEGASSDEEIYWYNKDKLWQLIPAF